jgi:hypothetical protein
MSAPTASMHHAFRDEKLAVPFRLLLWLYLIIPLCLLLQCLDTWFWGDYLRINLPSSPYHFVLFQILFGTPHIVASNILLASNADYLHHYRRQIILMTLAIAFAYFIGTRLLPYRLLYSVVACWTVLHVLKQQYGIAKGACKLPDRLLTLLLSLSVATGLAIYLGIFLRNSLDSDQLLWLKQIAGIGCIALFLTGVIFQDTVTSRFGKWFYWANIFLVLTSFYLYSQQQYFMAILVPRFVHDATAYLFYVTYDYNKHRQQPQNWLYRIAKNCNIHIFLVLPLLSFGLAFALQAYGDSLVNWITLHVLGVEFYKVITLGFLGYLALMHYYMESLTWQKDSSYRKYIAFRQ